jgi:hypothetical protein
LIDKVDNDLDGLGEPENNGLAHHAAARSRFGVIGLPTVARTPDPDESTMPNEISSPREEPRPFHPPRIADGDLERVRVAVRGIRYGEVRVIIQDGVIVQIERVEKQRLR